MVPSQIDNKLIVNYRYITSSQSQFSIRSCYLTATVKYKVSCLPNCICTGSIIKLLLRHNSRLGSIEQNTTLLIFFLIYKSRREQYWFRMTILYATSFFITVQESFTYILCFIRSANLIQHRKTFQQLKKIYDFLIGYLH